jgi:hypothetical protein
MLLAVGYSVIVYRLFSGKVSTDGQAHGHALTSNPPLAGDIDPAILPE